MIFKMQKCFNGKEEFAFRWFQQDDVIRIKNKDKEYKNKSFTFKDIPVKIMFNSFHVYFQALTIDFQWLCKSGNFSDIPNYIDITPAFRNGGTSDKSN